MSQLTKRERVLRTMRLQETDRVPLYDIIDNDAIIEHYAGEKLTVENGSRVKGTAIGRILDMTRMARGPREPGEYREDNGIVFRKERWMQWIIQRPFHDMTTMVEWIKGEIKRTEVQVFDQAYAESFHKEICDWQTIFAKNDPTGRNDPTVYMRESGVGLTEMYWWTSIEQFVYLMADYPDLVEEWLEARHQAELRRVAAIANPKLLPAVLTYDDIAYKTGLIFSPKWLRRLWLPRLKRLVDAWHTRDTFCLFHSDGNLWPIMDDLVAAGIDGLNPLEAMAGMTVKEARQRYPRLFLAGGVDVSQLMVFGTPEEVRTYCRQAIEDTSGRGFYLGSTTELLWDVRLENAIAMFEAAWETDKERG